MSLATRDTTETLTPREGEIELAERRTRSAKVFHLGGRRYRIGASIGPVHYRLDPFSEEPFEEIDLEVRLTPEAEWDAACETNGYQVRLWQSREVGGRTLRYIAQFRRAGHWLAMAPVVLIYQNDAGEKQVVSAVQAVGASTIDNERNTVTWSDAFGRGIDFAYNLRPDRFFKTLIVRDASALPKPTIDTRGLRLTLVMALAWDSTPANGFAAAGAPAEISDDLTGFDTPDEMTEATDFSFRDALSRDVWWLRKPMAWDSAEELQSVEVDWSLRRAGGRVFATFSVAAAALQQAIYPVFIDTAISEEQVGANEDDGLEYGATHPGSPTSLIEGVYITLGARSTKYYMGGFRFQTLPIPQGATIDSATLTVKCRTTTTYTSELRCGAEDVDDSAAWNTTTHKLAENGYAARTTAYVDWDIGPWTVDIWYSTPSIASVVEEVVGRAGWALNNSMNLMLWYRYTSLPAINRFLNVCQYDEAGYGAKFNCEYTEPAPAGDWLFASD